MYAIIKTGGKQYRVSEGDVLNIEKLDVEAGSDTPNELTQAILATMEYGLLGVAEQYPKYVRIHTYRR